MTCSSIILPWIEPTDIALGDKIFDEQVQRSVFRYYAPPERDFPQATQLHAPAVWRINLCARFLSESELSEPYNL